MTEYSSKDESVENDTRMLIPESGPNGGIMVVNGMEQGLQINRDRGPRYSNEHRTGSELVVDSHTDDRVASQ